MELLQPDKIFSKDNLSEVERTALSELQTKVLEGHLNTNDYKRVNDDEDIKVMRDLKSITKKFEELTTKEQQFICDFPWKTSNFYILPKFHKSTEIIQAIARSDKDYIEMSPPDNLKGRPIVAGPASPTQRLSEFLDTLLKPIVPKLSTYVKDDWDFIRKIPREFHTSTSLFSYDVVSLYASIPHTLGIEAIDYWIDKRNDLIPGRFTKNFILESVKFILENNNFLFDNVMYKQVSGTAMGTKFAPPYACLTIGYLEETRLFPKILKNYFTDSTCLYIKDNFFRYMDDGFIALAQNIDAISLKNALNDLHPSIKFTMETGKMT